ncbi:MAG: N-acetylneuraminate synthase [Rhodospirillaceae bacterium]|nr:N-acetylneuraminate synthase [Rhodospirillales bacterium]
MPASVFIIAEAGVNHNGELERALALVDTAAQCGVDAVKFQTFKATALASAAAPKAAYQARETGSGESQLDMLRRLELSPSDHHVLAERCRERNILFLSTPFDMGSLHFLATDMALPVIKIGSGDLTNAPLLMQIARLGLPVILSTGMSDMDDVAEALGALAFGYAADPALTPGPAGFATALQRHGDRLQGLVTLLHCTTEYPAPLADTHLRAMATLADRFGLPVGFSDHTQGITAALGAVALGARVIEKHFTLDRTLPGPDHKASLEPAALRALADGVREMELALGDSIKRPCAAELSNRIVARKSVVATGPIQAGTILDSGHLCLKRPGDGIRPAQLWQLIGQPANRDYAADEKIDPCLLP